MSSLLDGAQPAPASGMRDASTTEGDTIQLSPVAVSLSAAVLFVNGFISLRFKLGLHTQLVIASIRMVVQLSLLGYLLVPIFTYDKWWLVLLYGMFMLVIASLEAVQRPSYTFQGMLLNTLLSMASATGLLLSYLVLVVLGLRPVWEAQYVIPLAGMLLGNATSAVSVGLSAVLEDLAANRAVIEHQLSLGANRFEATDDAVRRALKVSMTPLLNQMSVMGIVSIPGMMTGQILAGGNPAQAARYQMVIIFIVVAATSLASVSSIYLAVFHVVDSNHMYRADRLIKKQPLQHAQGPGGSFAQWAAAVRRGGVAARRKGMALGSCLAAACCCCLFPPPPAPRRRRAHGGGSGGSDGAVAEALLPAGAWSFPSKSGLRPLWPTWIRPGRRGGSHLHRVAAAATVAAVQPDQLFSADTSTSSILGELLAPTHGLLGGGGGGGITSALSTRSAAAAASLTGPPTATPPRLSWDERQWDQEAAEIDDRGTAGCSSAAAIVYDAGEGGVGGGGSAASDLAAAAAQQQPLLGPESPWPPPLASTLAGGERTGEPSTVLRSSMSAVVAVGGWLGSQASAGWGNAWGVLGWWRPSGAAAPPPAAVLPLPPPAPPADGPGPEPGPGARRDGYQQL